MRPDSQRRRLGAVSHRFGDDTRRLAGRPVAPADCQIAAIARSRGMAVATRNVRDFADAGIDVIDPWMGS